MPANPLLRLLAGLALSRPSFVTLALRHTDDCSSNNLKSYICRTDVSTYKRLWGDYSYPLDPLETRAFIIIGPASGMSDDESSEKKFQLKCKAALLTYHVAVPFEHFESLKVWDRVKSFSFCQEHEGDHIGSHIFLEFWKQVDHGLDNWYYGDHKCDARPNLSKGSGYRPSADRGHFYVACEFKKNKVKVVTNWPANQAYVVKTHWVCTLWQQNKLQEGKAIECAAYYQALTPSFKAMVQVNDSFRVAKLREDHFRKRRKILENTLTAWKPLPEIEPFLDQFLKIRDRYNFLWMWSAESVKWVGKSKYVKAHFKCFVHDGAINWSGYDPSVTDAVVFDDCAKICDYIKENKPLFQANRERYTINASATNMYAQDIDTCDKKIIVLANFAPKAEWTKQNAFIIELKNKLY